MCENQSDIWFFGEQMNEISSFLAHLIMGIYPNLTEFALLIGPIFTVNGNSDLILTFIYCAICRAFLSYLI